MLLRDYFQYHVLPIGHNGLASSSSNNFEFNSPFGKSYPLAALGALQSALLFGGQIDRLQIHSNLSNVFVY